MSPIDTRELAGMTLGNQTVEARSCPHCDYDLKGLKIGGNCPECGSPIRVEAGSTYADNLAYAPRRYLRRLTAAMACSALFGVLTALAFVSALFSPSAGPIDGVIAAVLAMALAGSVWMVVQPRPAQSRDGDAVLDGPLCRNAAWGLTLALCPAGVFLALMLGNAAWNELALITAFVLAGLVGLAGVLALGIYLLMLANWANEDGAQAAAVGGAWAIGIGGLFGSISLGLSVIPQTGIALVDLLTSTFGFLWILLGALAMLGVILVVYANAAMAISLGWAWQNNTAAAERDIRVAERRASEASRDYDRLDAMLAPHGSVPTPEPEAAPIPLVVDEPTGRATPSRIAHTRQGISAPRRPRPDPDTPEPRVRDIDDLGI